MRFIPTILVALALCGTAAAQTPPAPAKSPPATAKKPPVSAPAPSGDEELALAALEGLMMQPPERALPIIKKVLAGSQSTTVKQRALFVLSQLESPEAQQILLQTSRSTDAALRREAIRAIGIGGDPKALDALKEIYNSGGDEVKQEVMQAWVISENKEAIYQAALNAKSEDEANHAVRMLGAIGATEELRKLGDRPNAASGLVDAYAISGDLASLLKIVNGTGAHSLRVEAVRKIGIIESDAARAALRDIYTRNTDPEIREAALQGMLITGDEQGVLELYRAARTGDEKRALLRYLSMMDGDAALKAIDSALETKSHATAPVTAPSANTPSEKRFQRAAKQYQRVEKDGQTLYCRRGATKSLPHTCITESELRRQVEESEEARTLNPLRMPPNATTVPGGG